MAPDCSSHTASSPPVIAAAIRKVPASMRSGMMRWRAPCSFGHALNANASACPRPQCWLPSCSAASAKSLTSGSRAQFSSKVSPSARTAAISRSSVPVTVIFSNRMRARQAFGARFQISVLLRDLGAQLFQSFEVQVDGTRADGAAARQRNAARPVRATSGPNTSEEARMVFTSSY